MCGTPARGSGATPRCRPELLEHTKLNHTRSKSVKCDQVLQERRNTALQKIPNLTCSWNMVPHFTLFQQPNHTSHSWQKAHTKPNVILKYTKPHHSCRAAGPSVSNPPKCLGSSTHPQHQTLAPTPYKQVRGGGRKQGRGGGAHLHVHAPNLHSSSLLLSSQNLSDTRRMCIDEEGHQMDRG